MRDNHTDGETPDQERRPSVVWTDNGPCVTADEDGIVTLYKLNIVASWQFRLPGLWDAPAPKFEVTPQTPADAMALIAASTSSRRNLSGDHQHERLRL
jgi:hypothetical protein